MGDNSDAGLKGQLDVLPNLYQAVFSYVLWVTCDVTREGPQQCVWKRSSKTFKGSAVKVLQHTQLSYSAVFMHSVG